MKALSSRGPMADRMIRGRRGALAAAAVILLASGAIASAQEAGSGVPATAASEAVAPQASAAPPASNTSSAAAPAMAPSSPAPVGAPQETAPAAAPSPEATRATVANEVPLEAEAPAATGALPHDLSPWGMFLAADYVVKAVMLGLAFASLVTWTIWLAKVLELAAAKRRALAGVKRLGTAGGLPAPDGLDAAGWRRGPVAALVRAAVEERAKSADLPADGVKERAAVALHRIEARAGRRMTRGTGLLATIGSTAPFVGLFGTVWGIMNSFIGISQANTTNLAVVAPGIAEALLATAIGLVAAIPAVIIYNVFARAIAGYKAVLSDASAGVLQHLSRDLDRAKFAARPVGGRPSLQAAE